MIEETERRDIERSDRKWSEFVGKPSTYIDHLAWLVVLPRRFHGYDVLSLLSQ